MDPKVLLMVWLSFFLQFSIGKESVLGLANASSSTPFDPSRVTQISWSPRVFVFKGFLTDEECAHLISLTRGSDNKTECAVKARKGDALLFFSLHPKRTVDPWSLHGSCPVTTGEKWSAIKWIHTRSLVMIKSVVADDVCADENPNYPVRALEGECEKNPLYLVGSDYNVGHCRKSCRMCS